jgi:hypothetical protein
VAMALVILPWTYRNYRVTGHFVLISGNASGEFLRGYVFAQPRYYLLRDRAYTEGENEANAMQEDVYDRRGVGWNVDREGQVQVTDEAVAEQAQNAELKEKLRQHPDAFLKKFVIALFMFWYVVTTRANSILVGTLALLAWALALVGFVQNEKSRRRFWVLVLPIASLNVTYAAILALGRYSAPCIPALLVLAAFGIDRLVARVRGTREEEAEASAFV